MKKTLLRLVEQYPVVVITGPRQSGKTTLCRTTFADKAYVNLEMPDIRQYAIDDPRSFLDDYADAPFFLFLSTIVAFHCIQQSLHYFKQKDPSEIVIDEYIGCLVTFCALPVHMNSLILGFLLFRFFDWMYSFCVFFFQAEDGIRDISV